MTARVFFFDTGTFKQIKS